MMYRCVSDSEFLGMLLYRLLLGNAAALALFSAIGVIGISSGSSIEFMLSLVAIFKTSAQVFRRVRPERI